MLVLTRNVGERVYLQVTEDLPKGSTIIVGVADIDSRRQAWLGFKAPRGVLILREELLEPAERQQ